MSDFEYSDEEQFDYSDDEYMYSDDEMGAEDNEDEIQVENMFYEAEDDLQSKKYDKARELFEKIVGMEQEKTESKWLFKSLSNIIRVCARLNDEENVVAYFQKLLDMVATVTRNEIADAINLILDDLSGMADSTELQTKLFELTSKAMRTDNPRLWFSINLRHAKMLQKQNLLENLQALLSFVEQTVEESSDLNSLSSLVMELRCLQIQVYSEMKQLKKMKDIYSKVQEITGALADPKIMGIIRESFGKMHVANKNWAPAENEFYSAFRSFQEIGDIKAKDCLKYAVFVNMLAGSEIDPFASPEAKVYKDDSEIIAIVNLHKAYEEGKIKRFQSILQNKNNKIKDDVVLGQLVEDILCNVRQQVICKRLGPFKSIRLSVLATELNTNIQEVQRLVERLILDEKIKGRIDQTSQILRLDDQQMNDGITIPCRYTAMKNAFAAIGERNIRMQVQAANQIKNIMYDWENFLTTQQPVNDVANYIKQVKTSEPK
eukprot:TRINITY_DN873_c0_g4_i1.p1 TRINITY_DN873_c0_g4~~TRINITY_DN873_c0_g4_i1.p1  ORF type:complete len:490 (-),score=162.99 TRINITY_DN873_c0_g4_i1:170-1639(-)